MWKSRKSRKSRTSRKARKNGKAQSRKIKRKSNIKTAPTPVKKSLRKKASRVHSNMSLTDMQRFAKSKGIPFGGLPKSHLMKKLRAYEY